jgi:hypothetical protein
MPQGGARAEVAAMDAVSNLVNKQGNGCLKRQANVTLVAPKRSVLKNGVRKMAES